MIKLRMRYILCILVGAVSLVSTQCKCPRAPKDFKEFDFSQVEPPVRDATTCKEIQARDNVTSVVALIKRFRTCAQMNKGESRKGRGATKTVMFPCRWQVVNLGLEKTGTSEIANLLRLLNAQHNMSFASPRGAAAG